MPLAVDLLLPLPLAPLRWLAPFGQPPGPVGARVAVPWRGGIRVGLVTGVSEVGGSRGLELKEAIAWLDDGPPVPERTVAWILAEARRTVCPAGVVLAGLALSSLRADLEHEVRELDAAGGPAGPWGPGERLDPERTEMLRGQGLLEERVRPAVPTHRVLTVGETPPADALQGPQRARQRSALAWLAEHGEVESGAALARDADVPESTVRTLVRKGYLRYAQRPAPPPEPPAPPEAVPWPADMQRDMGTPSSCAPTWIAGGRRADRLAHLVPALHEEVAAGRSPLIIAPERAWAEEAAAWLANDLPVVLARAEETPRRRRAWETALSEGPPTVIIGTWPVLAAPVRRPGRLIVLEAGAESHKLRSGSRSWIPEAARGWAELHGVPMTLTDVLAGPETVATAAAAATAAPAVPAATAATAAPARGPGRGGVDLPMPRVRWVLSDLGKTRSWPLGDEAIRVLRQVASRERQALVMVPRRGFSAALGCRDCGAAVMCPNCDLALRWHARDGRLRCHQCGHDVPPPQACPACGGLELEAQRAAGSEWVLRALAGAVPTLPRYRWDGDVRDDLSELYRGAPGVVVGTSAVLRLAPLPVLSLLAATQVDGALHADDFRAEERVLRTLAALQESAGARAPLGLIQTFAPEHPTLRAFVEGTPEAVQRALADMDERRRRFGYPPYGRMARVQASARSADAAWRALLEVADRARTAGAAEDELLGPAPAAIARVRGRSVAHLLVRTATAERRHELLTAATAGTFSGVRLRVDVDPRDIGEVLE
ncbi:MAG: hypothetical protein U5J97_07670 [Trueperaceae bacterium]|nr:hypothetical protein [Trueperaceae bacterium]